MRIVSTLLLGLLLAPAALAQTGDKAPVKGVGAAKEGDLVTVRGQEFRLFGIDAPDKGQTCENVRGQQYDCHALSTRILSLLINDRNIECTPRDQSPATGPKLALCRAENGDDLAYAMVERGMALAYRPLSFDYISIEARAISFRRGLWGGRVEPPWLWRSRQTEEKLEEMRKARKGGGQ